MTAYLSAMENMPDLVSLTEKFKGHIYKCLDGTIYQAHFNCIPKFKYWGVDGDPTSLYIKFLQAMKTVEARHETNICRYFTALKIMQLLAMQMLKFTVIFIKDIISYMSNTYTTPNQYFSSTT